MKGETGSFALTPLIVICMVFGIAGFYLADGLGGWVGVALPVMFVGLRKLLQ